MSTRQDYLNISNIANEMYKKNELRNELLRTSKNRLKINVTIGNASYTFGSGDYEFDNLCEIIRDIDVDEEWGDYEF